MATDPAWQTQVAVYGVLNDDATLGALITGVYDFVPAGTALPYVTIGDDTAVDWSAKSFDGQEITLTIHSWAEAGGRKTVKAIMAEVYRLLHDTSLIIAGQTHVLTRFEFATTLMDPDGITHHGVQRFRVLVTN